MERPSVAYHRWPNPWWRSWRRGPEPTGHFQLMVPTRHPVDQLTSWGNQVGSLVYPIIYKVFLYTSKRWLLWLFWDFWTINSRWKAFTCLGFVLFFMFYGLYHGKSPWKTTMWEDTFYIFQASWANPSYRYQELFTDSPLLQKILCYFWKGGHGKKNRSWRHPPKSIVATMLSTAFLVGGFK